MSSRLGYLISAQPPIINEETALYKLLLSKSLILKGFGTLKTLGFTHRKMRSDSFNGEQYVARFPWKENHPQLKSNFFMADKWTRSLVKKLFKTPSKAAIYAGIIQQQLNSGFLVKVPWSNKPGNHYVSHFDVENLDSKTTSARIVYDWAMKTVDSGCRFDLVLAMIPDKKRLLISMRATT